MINISQVEFNVNIKYSNTMGGKKLGFEMTQKKKRKLNISSHIDHSLVAIFT